MIMSFNFCGLAGMGICLGGILQLAQDGSHLAAKGPIDLLRECKVDKVLPPDRHTLVQGGRSL